MAWKKPDLDTYRGRKTVTDILRIVAVVLLLLVLLAGGLLLFGRRYLVYQDGRVSLELPFFHRDRPDMSQSEPDPGHVSSSGDRSGDVSQEEPPAELPMGAVTVSVEAVLNGTAEELARQAGADALVIDMKGDPGTLGWKSGEAIARNVRANSQTENVNETLAQFLKETQLYTVARLSCFKDGLVGADSGCVLRDSGGNRWKDSDGALWSTPENNAVRSYLARAAAELAAMGFDEVLLDSCGWPGGGDGAAVNGDPARDLERRTETVDKFLAETVQALEPYDAALAIRCSAATAAGQDGLTGLTPALLEQYADRLWIDGSTAGLGAGSVAVVTRLSESRTEPQAILP